MKEKLPLEVKNRQAMPWSKVVKRHHRANKEIKRYPLEEVAFTKESKGRPPSEEDVSTQNTEEPLASKESAPVFEEKQDTAMELEEELSEREQGYAKGLAEGELKGHQQGYTLGLAEGQLKGHEQGYSKGLAEGELKGHEQGYTKGFAEGKSAGSEIRQEELCEYENTHRLLLRLIDDLKDFTENVVLESENDLLQIAIGIAQKILRKEISENPEVILGFVQEALKNVGPMESALIRIHPQDIEMLTRKRPEILAAVEGLTLLKFEPDPKLLPGDCIVMGSDRLVDGRLPSQLAILEQRLLPQSKEGSGT